MSTIFAIESGSSAAGAAIMRDGELISEVYANTGLTHSQTLMPICDETFKRAGLNPSDIDYFAAAVGPGSFTGLRIGLGTAKGMAFAVGKSCIAVPSLEALAYGAPNRDVVVPVLDARRKRVYCAEFNTTGEVKRVRDDAVEEISDLADLLCGKHVYFIGDAARVCYNTLKDKLDCTSAPEYSAMPHASWVAAAATVRADAGLICTAAELTASYLQLPQAERELLARNAQQQTN